MEGKTATQAHAPAGATASSSSAPSQAKRAQKASVPKASKRKTSNRKTSNQKTPGSRTAKASTPGNGTDKSKTAKAKATKAVAAGASRITKARTSQTARKSPAQTISAAKEQAAAMAQATASKTEASKPQEAQAHKKSTPKSSAKPTKAKPTKTELARNQKAGERARTSIRDSFLKATSYQAAVLADRDPEDLHQMRVELRRLRTAMAVFEPVIDAPVSDRRIAKIAKTLGVVRDLDVLQQWLSDYAAKDSCPKAESKKLGKVQKRLRKQRKKAMASVQRMLKGKRYKDFIRTMEQWIESPQLQPTGHLSLAAILTDLLSPLISRLLLHPGLWTATEVKQDKVHNTVITPVDVPPEDLGKTLKTHGKALHDLRKQMKRVRYQAEMFKDCYGRTYSNRLKEFKAIQTCLGDLQDEVVFNDFLVTTLGKKWPAQLPRLAQFLKQQHQQHWQAWQTLQGQYLTPNFRQKLRQMVQE